MKKITFSIMLSLSLISGYIFTNDIKAHASTNIENYDFNGNGIVDIRDVANLSKLYDLESGNVNWDSKYDLNGDNIIDIFDLVKISKAIGTTAIKYGNTQGNIVNSGFATKQDDWIYYCEYDASSNYPGAPNNSSIYKMKTDGSNKTKLINVRAFDLNIKGDWLYYISNSKIYKIMIDGSNNQKVSDSVVLNGMIIVGDLIYVNTGMGPIILNLDGSYYGSLWGSPREFVVSGDTVYFNYMGDNDSIWTTGSSNNKLNNEPSYNINVYEDNIYYINLEDDICSINTNGNNRTVIGSDKAKSLLVDEGWIYYSNESDSNKLYKMRLDGTCRTIVSNTSIITFNIVGDWVVSIVDAKTNFIKK